jgi:hypothetical protein
MIRMPLTAPSPTAYAYPWILLRFGGSDRTKRPASRLAYIVKAVASNGQVTGYRAHTWSNPQQVWSKTLRHITDDDILHEWRHKPTARDVERAKRRLKVGE